ncbi:MAG TPA: PAS domain-containing protein [Parvibaculum sp.]
MSERLETATSETNPTRFEHQTLATVKAYWDEKRGSRRMPSRADINPADLKEHLGWISLLDVLPGFADFRFRLVGTKVTRYFRAESTGKTASETFAPFGPGVVKGIIAVYRKTARDQVPVRAYGDAGWLGAAYQKFEALYLPLSDDGITCNIILSTFIFDYARVAAKSDSSLP